jgi:aryl-alcohol dehydrogenase-like predicted oxidoreductase
MADMTFRQLGRSGLRVSTVGLGGNNFRTRLDDDASRAVVDAAIGAGITLFDTADFYGAGGSEELLGDVLGARREHVVLATKFGLPMPGAAPDEARGSRRYVNEAVRASLRRLRTDWIDLYQLHVPDPLTPIEETLGALDDLVHQGIVWYVGSSQFAAWQVTDADWTARTRRVNRFISTQCEYSLLHRAPEAELVPACEAHGVGTLPFFPLANGLLTGKFHRGRPLPTGTRLGDESQRAARVATDDALGRVEALRAIADGAGLSMVELAIGWLTGRPTVGSVTAGASTPEQVHANAAAATVVLDADVLHAIDRVAPGPG